VTVRVKGTAGFVALASQQVPVGSEVDATRGRVRLESRAGTSTQTADFYQGRFVISQAGTADGTTVLRLSGPLSCARRISAAKPSERHLWGSGKGKFRTTGRYAAAAVRGTTWLTRDTCRQTVVQVRTGRVQVLDLVRKRSVIVPAGKSYIAHRP
jgi:hypothetical protein